MKFYMRLPRNAKETLLFMTIISLISVNVIAPLITFLESGFSMHIWWNVLKIIPLIWICVVVIIAVMFRPIEWITYKIIDRKDSFNAHIVVNTLCSVFLMAILLTVVGEWIGSRHISFDPIETFFHKYPRNFGIAFGVEILFAQPVAHFVMHYYHKRIDSKVKK